MSISNSREYHDFMSNCCTVTRLLAWPIHAANFQMTGFSEIARAKPAACTYLAHHELESVKNSNVLVKAKGWGKSDSGRLIISLHSSMVIRCSWLSEHLTRVSMQASEAGMSNEALCSFQSDCMKTLRSKPLWLLYFLIIRLHSRCLCNLMTRKYHIQLKSTRLVAQSLHVS